MIKYFVYIFLALFFSKILYAKDVNIAETIHLSFFCELDKKIIKNSEHNYQTFFAKDLNEETLDEFEIEAIKPKTLLVKGLSIFLSNSKELKVKVVNRDVILFKAIDSKKKYSESALLDRNTGELIHEITKNIKSENNEKYISFYLCSKKDKKV